MVGNCFFFSDGRNRTIYFIVFFIAGCFQYTGDLFFFDPMNCSAHRSCLHHAPNGTLHRILTGVIRKTSQIPHLKGTVQNWDHSNSSPANVATATPQLSVCRLLNINCQMTRVTGVCQGSTWSCTARRTRVKMFPFKRCSVRATTMQFGAVFQQRQNKAKKASTAMDCAKENSVKFLKANV